MLSDLTVSKLIFETVDPVNARRFSEMLGEQEVLESSETVSSGANEIRDGVSFSHQKRFQPLIRSSEIMQLKPLNCYAKIANVDCVFKHEFAYLNLPIVGCDFKARQIATCSKESETMHDDTEEMDNEEVLNDNPSEQGEQNNDEEKEKANAIFEYKLTGS